ncbi:MAG: PilZ domain-containing protein [Sphingobium sp.]
MALKQSSDQIAPQVGGVVPSRTGGICDRRDGIRHQVLIPASVWGGGRNWTASIHNFSTRGMTLKTEWPDTAVGMAIVVSSHLFGDITGMIRWRRGASIGIHLLNALSIDQVAMARTATPSASAHQPRAGRARLRLQAVAIRQERRRRVEVCNISVGGAMISTSMPYPPGQALIIELPGLPALAGQVRWNRGGRCGLQWNRALPVATARTLAQCEKLPDIWLEEVLSHHGAAPAPPAISDDGAPPIQSRRLPAGTTAAGVAIASSIFDPRSSVTGIGGPRHNLAHR